MVSLLESFLLTLETFPVQQKRVNDIVSYSSEASTNDFKLSPKAIVALEGFCFICLLHLSITFLSSN